MSTAADDPELNVAGVPELTPLGKRIELLRLERRMSKRILAQRAGTSRQQLWRVMTGKSELTSSLCARLSEVLEIDSRTLRDPLSDLTRGDAPDRGLVILRDTARVTEAGPADGRLCQTLEEYLSSPHGLARTMDTFPLTDDGRLLKRAVLNAIEEIAMSRAVELPSFVFELRRAVVNDRDASPDDAETTAPATLTTSA